ncbi:haloacid dehalogenase type II [Flavobacterium cellulosilyticum]|uniref:Haloacid dehalogenase type II n=1 Tax=Flavobacterium cellulosilyticum TaxID=2541731 RepID=A0A4R5CK10_9FLAO|nr:haloacid dehalogenase type II [Flavobacterium cellulosilyticum]TDD98693.1 haloacid dehalogenase type II [Flavobacterium cellulosilyticum]
MKKASLATIAEITAPSLSFGSETKFKETAVSISAAVPPKVLFFDVNESLLDLENIKKSVGKALGGREDLASLWFTTMLHYSLVETTARQYTDFGTIGAASLRMVAANNGVQLTENDAKSAVSAIASLPAHPEVKEALMKLKKAGYILVSLTNSSNKGVKNQFKNAGLTDFFDQRLSIEDIGKYKPHSDVYDWAARKLGVQPSECMMIAAHGWDIAGAIWAGWRGAFIARPGQQLYPLAPLPEINETDLLKIAQKLIYYKQ